MALGIIKKKAISLIFKLMAFIYSKLPELYKQKIKNKFSKITLRKMKDLTRYKMNNIEKMNARLSELSQEEKKIYGTGDGAADNYTGPDPSQDPGQDFKRETELIKKMMDGPAFTGIIENSERIIFSPLVKNYPAAGDVVEENLSAHAEMTAAFIKIKTGGEINFEKAYMIYTGILLSTVLGVIAEEKIKDRRAAKKNQGKKQESKSE